MPADIWVNVDGVNRQYDKGYANIDGTWREISNIWVNINGTWKEISIQAVLSYLGTAPVLSTLKAHAAAATVSNYVLVAGGAGDYITATDTIETYHVPDLVKSTTITISGVHSQGYASLPNHAVFAGGLYDSYRNTKRSTANIYAYNSSLVGSYAGGLSYAKGKMASVVLGNYAIFHQGAYYDTDGWHSSGHTDFLNSSLVKGTPHYTPDGVEGAGGATIGNYAIFAGGNYMNGGSISETKTTVIAYNTSLVKSTLTALPSGAAFMAGASNSSYALMCGGERNSPVYAWNSSLVRTTPSDALVRPWCKGASHEQFAIFSGGTGQDSNYMIISYSDVVYYDTSLVKRTTNMPLNVSYHCTATLGDYIFLIGGWTYDGTGQFGSGIAHKSVYVYTVT